MPKTKTSVEKTTKKNVLSRNRPNKTKQATTTTTTTKEHGDGDYSTSDDDFIPTTSTRNKGGGGGGGDGAVKGTRSRPQTQPKPAPAPRLQTLRKRTVEKYIDNSFTSDDDTFTPPSGHGQPSRKQKRATWTHPPQPHKNSSPPPPPPPPPSAAPHPPESGIDQEPPPPPPSAAPNPPELGIDQEPPPPPPPASALPHPPELGIDQEPPTTFESFNEILQQIPDFPNLTQELETTGQITKFISTTPELQEVERESLMELFHLKNEMELEHEKMISNLQMIQAGKPKELMDMSMHSVVKLMEQVGGKRVENFNQLLQIMATVQGSELEAIINQRQPTCGGGGGGDLSTLSEEGEELSSPEAGRLGRLMSVSKGPSVMSGFKNSTRVFPTAVEMTQPTAPCTPANAVYQFGGNPLMMSSMSTSKAPRLLKAGEVAYSMKGSPLMMPKIGGLIGAGEERIPVNDSDGRKIVEVVLRKGETGKEKEFKDFVTDVRGLIATKSIKQDRIRPPRVVGKATTAAAGSAKKKPVWNNK